MKKAARAAGSGCRKSTFWILVSCSSNPEIREAGKDHGEMLVAHCSTPRATTAENLAKARKDSSREPGRPLALQKLA